MVPASPMVFDASKHVGLAYARSRSRLRGGRKFDGGAVTSDLDLSLSELYRAF
jgi:hypothetical protein